MKYIKAYTPGYVEITQDNFLNHTSIPLTMVDKISFILDENSCTYKVISKSLAKKPVVIYIDSNDREIMLKEAFDEWFYLIVDFGKSNQYYKCDQLDGLVSLLKDLKVIYK